MHQLQITIIIQGWLGAQSCIFSKLCSYLTVRHGTLLLLGSHSPQLCVVPADRLDQTAADQFNFSFNYSSSDLLRVFADFLCFSSILLRHPLRHLLLRCSINKAAPSLMFNRETNILQIRFKLPDKLSGRRTTQRVRT